MKSSLLGLAVSSLLVFFFATRALSDEAAKIRRPNIILCMADDQGWSEVGFNGHDHIITPVMDEMARIGFRFDRFYSQAPNCAPTRGSCLTGRNAVRFGQFGPTMAMRPEEITVAEILKEHGYATGHYGKWHLGPVKASAPNCPGNQGFDEWLSHDNYFEIDPPLSKNGAPPEIYKGESSEVIVDEAIQFIKKSVAEEKPFFTVIWYGSCHGPQIALPEDLKHYQNIDSPIAEKLAHRYGEITAMDRSLGKLRTALRKLDVHRDTILWYTSDNGEPSNSWYQPRFNGCKGTLFEGGMRVPAMIEWPNGIPESGNSSVNAVTSDILPTICHWLDIPLPDRILDGISLVPVISGEMTERPQAIGFWRYGGSDESRHGAWMDFDSQTGQTPTNSNSATQFINWKHPVALKTDFPGDAAWTGSRYKLLLDFGGRHKDMDDVLTPVTENVSLFDLENDPMETTNVADKHPEIVEQMMQELHKWQASVERSLTGAEYDR